MSHSWKSALRKDPTDWLLDGTDPAVAAAALVELEDAAPDSPQVIEYRARVNTTPPVSQMLANQNPAGWWLSPKNPYKKHEGSAWQLIHLAQLRAIPEPCLERGLARLAETAGRFEGGFTATGAASGRIACLTANCSWAMMRLGLAANPRVESALEWLAREQAEDGGFPCTAMEYSLAPTCTMSVVKALRVWAANDPVRWKGPIERGIGHLIDRDLFRYVPALSGEWHLAIRENKWKAAEIRQHRQEWISRGRDLPKKAKAGWLRCGFPRGYNTDLLEILYIFAQMGVPRSPAIERGVALVLERQGRDGRWRNECSLQGSFGPGVKMEPRGEPSRALTLEALRVLRAYS